MPLSVETGPLGAGLSFRLFTGAQMSNTPWTMAEESQLSFPTPGAPDPEEQRLHHVTLSHIRGLGEASLKALLATYGNLAGVWHQPPDVLTKVLTAAGLLEVVCR